MRWKYYPANKAFDSFAAKWDLLNQSQHNHVLLDSRFIRLLLKHFGSNDVLLGISDDSEHRGMALLSRKKLGIWETFQPSQAPIGPFLLGYSDRIGASLLEIMRSLPGVCFQCAVLQQDPDFSPLPRVAPDSRFEASDYVQTGRLRVQGAFAEYWQGRSKDLRDNLARRQRRLQKEGRMPELVVHRAASSMARCLHEYGRMESVSWKAEGGTAIGGDNAQALFYRDVMESFAELGEAFVYELQLNGRVIGSELYLGRADMLVGLKTTYDGAFRTMSPGFLMKYEIIRRIFSDGIFHNVEFYGRVMEWHSKWINEVRTMYHLSVWNRPAMKVRSLLKRFL
jgi:Acetyltransferase (GNAT) domain